MAMTCHFHLATSPQSILSYTHEHQHHHPPFQPQNHFSRNNRGRRSPRPSTKAHVGQANPGDSKSQGELDTKAFAKCNYLDTGHILSDMAYCKVAELIGHNPRPLDYSIVKEYIVSKSWNRGLCDLGYSYVPESLIQKVGNKPYMSYTRGLKFTT